MKFENQLQQLMEQHKNLSTVFVSGLNIIINPLLVKWKLLYSLQIGGI